MLANGISAKSGKTIFNANGTDSESEGSAAADPLVSGEAQLLPGEAEDEGITGTIRIEDLHSGWVQEGDAWYFRDEEGSLLTGWLSQEENDIEIFFASFMKYFCYGRQCSTTPRRNGKKRERGVAAIV